MAAKYAIALGEARETLYWLRLLATDPLVGDIDPLINEANESVAMLTTTVKNSGRSGTPPPLYPLPSPSSLELFLSSALCPLPSLL